MRRVLPLLAPLALLLVGCPEDEVEDDPEYPEISDPDAPDDEPERDPGEEGSEEDAPGRETVEGAVCGEATFRGVWPDVDDGICTDGTFPVATAREVAGLCTDGVEALVDGTRYRTIQGAIDAADSGAVVSICPGTYDLDRPLAVSAVRGLTIEGATGDPADVVLSGGRRGRVLQVQTASLTLANLTLQDGYDRSSGGAVYARNARLTIACSVLRDNFSAYDGGAVAAGGDPAELVLIDSDLSGNVADYEGGAVSFASSGDTAGQLVVSGSTLSDNHAGYEGGAISVGAWQHDDLVIVDSSLSDNSGDYSGGAIQTGSWGSGTVTVLSSDLRDNHAANGGGQIDLGGWSESTMAWFEDSVFVGAGLDGGDRSGIEVGSRVECAEIFLVASAVAMHEGTGVYGSDVTSVYSRASNFGEGTRDNGVDVTGACGVLDDLGADESFACE